MGLVTGAGRGLGRLIAKELASCGMAVALTARTVEQLDEVAAELEEVGGQVLVAPGDVTDRLSVESLVARVEGGLGPIDLLVNAATVGTAGEFLATDPDHWWQTLEVTLRGSMLCSHYVLRRMVPRRRGRIVNLAGEAGAVPAPVGSDRACSQAALLRLTDSLAAAMWEHRICVFAVSPPPRGGEPPLEEATTGDRELEALAKLVAELAGGRADRLTGRCLRVHDDLGELLARAGEIEQEDAQQLRLRCLRPRSQAPSGGWVPPVRLRDAPID